MMKSGRSRFGRSDAVWHRIEFRSETQCRLEHVQKYNFITSQNLATILINIGQKEPSDGKIFGSLMIFGQPTIEIEPSESSLTDRPTESLFGLRF